MNEELKKEVIAFLKELIAIEKAIKEVTKK